MTAVPTRLRAAVLAHLQRSEGASRSQLARALGCAPSTMTGVVAGLIDEGVLEQYRPPAAARGAGRPPSHLRIRLQGHVLAIEFDHDRVRAGVAGRDAVLQASAAIEVDTARSPAMAVEVAARLSRRVLADASVDPAGLRAVGVGLPGPVNTATGVVGSSSVLPNWRDANVMRLFRRHLGGVPLWVDNDANLCALGEHEMGRARGLRDFVFVKASTGLGGCIYLDGQIVRGAHGAAGEIGHVALPGERTVCRCGNRGCLETVSATPALLRQVRTLFPDVHDLASLRRFAAGAESVGRALFDMGARLGVQLAQLCTAFDVDQVLAAGELVELGDHYLDGVRDTIRRWIHPSLAATVAVHRSALHDSAGLTGAAIAARQLALRS